MRTFHLTLGTVEGLGVEYLIMQPRDCFTNNRVRDGELVVCLTPGPTFGFCPGGFLAYSHRGDLGGVAGFLSPKPAEEVTRNLNGHPSKY